MQDQEILVYGLSPEKWMDRFSESPFAVKSFAYFDMLKELGCESIMGYLFYKICRKNYPEYLDKRGHIHPQPITQHYK